MKKIVSYFTIFDKVSLVSRPLAPSENAETIIREIKRLIENGDILFSTDLKLIHVLDLIEENGKFEVNLISKEVFDFSNFIPPKKTEDKKD